MNLPKEHGLTEKKQV